MTNPNTETISPYVDIDFTGWGQAKIALWRAFNLYANTFMEKYSDRLDMEVDGPIICAHACDAMFPILTADEKNQLCADVMEEARAALDIYWARLDAAGE